MQTCLSVLQDLTLHMDEIHTKLVDIMQDRLHFAARQLVVEAEAWGKAAPARATPVGAVVPDAVLAESVRSLVRQLGTLRNVLSPILQKEEVR